MINRLSVELGNFPGGHKSFRDLVELKIVSLNCVKKWFLTAKEGTARIRVQVSAAHTKEDLDFAVKAFKEVKEEMGI